ncbi:MAG: hypothetical protein LOD87_08805, partial [Planifilum fulgidum]
YIPFGEARDHGTEKGDSGIRRAPDGYSDHGTEKGDSGIRRAPDGYICLSIFVHVLWYDENVM